MPRPSLAVVFLSILLPATAPADDLARPVALRLAGGTTVEGRLAGYDPPGVWRLATDGGERLFPRGDVADVVFLDVAESLRREGRLAPPPALAVLDEAGRAGLQVALEGLCDPSWEVRQDADATLRALGRGALDDLRRAAEEANDPEARLRLAAIVRSLEYPGRHGTLSLRQDLVLLEAVRPAQPGRSATRPVRLQLLRAGQGPMRLTAVATSPGVAMAHVVPLGRVDPTAGWDGGALVVGGRPVPGYDLFARPTDPAPVRYLEGVDLEAGASYAIRATRADAERVVLFTAIEVTPTGVSYSLQVLHEATLPARAAEPLPPEGEVVLWDANATRDRLKGSFSFRGATRDGIGSSAAADVVFWTRPNDGKLAIAVSDRRFGIRPADVDDWRTAGIGDLAGGGYGADVEVVPGAVHALRMDRPEATGAFFEIVEVGPTEGDSPGWVRLRWRRL